MLNELTVPLHLPGDVLAVAGEYGDEAAPAEKKRVLCPSYRMPIFLAVNWARSMRNFFM